MRKVVAAEFVSLDGVMESPDKWHFPYFNEEWAAFWPGQDPEETRWPLR